MVISFMKHGNNCGDQTSRSIKLLSKGLYEGCFGAGKWVDISGWFLCSWKEKEPMPAKLLLMLGHPFLTITGTRIYVLEETLTMDSTYSKQRGTQTMFFHAFILMCSIHLCWIYLIQVWEMTRPCFLTRKFTTSFLFLLSCPPLPSVSLLPSTKPLSR